MSCDELKGAMPPWSESAFPTPKKPSQRTQPVGGYIEFEAEDALIHAATNNRAGVDVNSRSSVRGKLWGKQ